MTEEQILVIKCAYADLKGALQSYEQMAYSEHDWDSHRLTIEEMEIYFDFIEK